MHEVDRCNIQFSLLQCFDWYTDRFECFSSTFASVVPLSALTFLIWPREGRSTCLLHTDCCLLCFDCFWFVSADSASLVTVSTLLLHPHSTFRALNLQTVQPVAAGRDRPQRA